MTAEGRSGLMEQRSAVKVSIFFTFCFPTQEYPTRVSNNVWPFVLECVCAFGFVGSFLPSNLALQVAAARLSLMCFDAVSLLGVGFTSNHLRFGK